MTYKTGDRHRISDYWIDTFEEKITEYWVRQITSCTHPKEVGFPSDSVNLENLKVSFSVKRAISILTLKKVLLYLCSEHTSMLSWMMTYITSIMMMNLDFDWNGNIFLRKRRPFSYWSHIT